MLFLYDYFCILLNIHLTHARSCSCRHSLSWVVFMPSSGIGLVVSVPIMREAFPRHEVNMWSNWTQISNCVGIPHRYIWEYQYGLLYVISYCPWRDDGVVVTSRRRRDVVLTSLWRCFCAVCPLGSHCCPRWPPDSPRAVASSVPLILSRQLLIGWYPYSLP